MFDPIRNRIHDIQSMDSTFHVFGALNCLNRSAIRDL